MSSSERKRQLSRDRNRSYRERQRAKNAPASPIQYALSVMNDPDADAKRRDSMARALLAFQRGGGKLPAKAENVPPAGQSEGGEEQPWSVVLGGGKK